MSRAARPEREAFRPRPRIVVVNDDAVQLAILVGLPRKGGHSVLPCDGSSHARNRRMAVLPPSALAGTLRIQQDPHPSMRLLIHTGPTEYQISEKLAEIGIRREHVVFKPVTDLSALVRRIELLTGARQESCDTQHTM